MRHVAAYLLAALGESEPTAETIKNILGSVGVEAEDKQLALVIQKFAGKNIDELIAAGAALLSSMPAGGVAAGGAAPAAAAGGAAPAAAEEKKEEKKEEPQEESDDDMGFGLFD